MADPTVRVLKIASHNVQGLNSPLKQRKVFDSYKSLNLDIVMLQETNFPIRYSPNFLYSHYPQVHLANAETKTKGVLILFSKSCKFDSIFTFKDPEGRFFLVKGTI